MGKLILETGVDNEILRKVSTPVDKVDKHIAQFIEDMKVSMHDEKGIGLAAPQVGHNIRVIVVMLDCQSKNPSVLGMVNPEITYFSEEKEYGEEGCLSVPGFFDNVWRSKEVIVKYLDQKGREQMLRLEGLNARVVQHEIDHLNGILFVDRLDEGPQNGEVRMEAGAL